MQAARPPQSWGSPPALRRNAGTDTSDQVVLGLLFALALLAGCGAETDEPSVEDELEEDGGVEAKPLSFCEGATSFVYEPQSGRMTAFPDDFFTVDDDTTLTGLRVHAIADDNLVLSDSSQTAANIFEDLSTLDGFGTTAGLYLTFSGALDPGTLPPSGDGSGSAEASLVLVELRGAETRFLDFEWRLLESGNAAGEVLLLVMPMVALQPKSLHALAVTNRVKDRSGDCVSPPETLRRLLSGPAEEPGLERLAGRFREMTAALVDAGTVEDAGEISAAVVFTTQHTVEDSMAVAENIRASDPSFEPVGDCVDSGMGYRICEGQFEASDYRTNGRNVDETDISAKSRYVLKTVIYLPEVTPSPPRTVIYGHGLGGDRFQAEALAEAVAADGFAVVAIDAVNHGEHPHQGDSGLLSAVTPIAGFFGLWANLQNGVIDWRVDGLQLRDNFRQSTYDKLQLIEVIRSEPDVDGDGVADLGIDELSYLGVSLGGIMSAELAALAPEIEVLLPVVPGARVVGIIEDSATFSLLVDVLRATATDGEIATFFPLLQTVIDRADPGAYLPHVIENRLPGFDQAAPQVLMSMVLQDEVVPPSSNLFFARCLGAPHVGEQLLPVGTIAHEPGLPVSANIDPSHTAGLFQYDLVPAQDGATLEPATHGNVGRSSVFQLQAVHFLQSYLEDGVAEIIDPYIELGLK